MCADTSGVLLGLKLKNMDKILSTGALKSSIRLKLAILVISKFLQNYRFFEKKFFFEKIELFRKKIFSSKTCEEPQGRAIVVWSSYGAHFFRNCLYFAFGIK